MRVMLQWACGSCTRCGKGLAKMECVQQSEKQMERERTRERQRERGGERKRSRERGIP